MINSSFDSKGNYLGLADSIGIMVYRGTRALDYVDNYVNGLGQGEGFNIT